MKIKNAFSVAEILVTVAVLGVIAMLVLNVVNGQDNLQKEFVRRYEMSVPKLTDIAQFAAQNADTYEDWWADSNALSGLDCDAENHSDCLKRAFLSVSPQLEDCTTDDCKLILSDDDLKVVKKILGTGSSYGINVNNLAHVKMSTGATLGLLYYDAECNTELKSNNDTSNRMVAKSCGVIFIDVNGNEPPNKFPTISDDENGTVTVTDPFSDRFMVAITKNSVEHTELINLAANCADGMTYDTTLKACTTPNSCSVDTAAQEYSKKVKEAHASNPELITLVYPDGEDKTDCYVVRCRTGAHPSKTHTCPTPCPVGQVLEGGIYLSNGGVIEDFEWSKKMCCTPVNNQTDLNNIRNNLSGTYCLMADIEFDINGPGSTAAEGWNPIGTASTPFTGKFYGNGHKISGLRIMKNIVAIGTTYPSMYAGLFGKVGATTISDLILEDINFTLGGGSTTATAVIRAGAVLGEGNGNSIVNNVLASGTIDASSSKLKTNELGGIIGRSGVVSSSQSLVNLRYSPNDCSNNTISVLGGVIGVYGTINKSINWGAIDVSPTCEYNKLYIGGISGQQGTVTDSFNGGSVSVSSSVELTATSTAHHIGGISGIATSKSITGVVNYGTVSSNPKKVKVNNVGGIVGSMTTGTLNSAINMGTISGSGGETNNISGIGGTIGITAKDTHNGNDTGTNNAKFPLQFNRDCRKGSSTNCYDAINAPNTLLPEGDDAYSIWAYKTPAAGAELNPVDTLVFRWQCKPYREDGFDCCRPRYAKWEPDLPECPAP